MIRKFLRLITSLIVAAPLIVFVTPEAKAAGCLLGEDYTTSTTGIYTTIKFINSTRSCDWSFPAGVTETEIAIVAGGGAGGGNQQPGGGGGGQILYNSSFSVSGTYAVTVGAGGAAVTGNNMGSNGGNSTFGTFTSIGGGGGGSSNSYENTEWNGQSGGSSGGSNRNGRAPKDITANT